VTEVTAGMVLLTFLLFCRIGGCLMVMPGFASPRIPMQVRLFLAVSVTLALAPILLPSVTSEFRSPPVAQIAQMIVSETLIGTVIGLMGRIFLFALQFMGVATASLVGFSGMGDPPIDESEPVPAVATLLTLTATVVLFLTGLHLEILRAIVASYSVIGVSDLFDPRFALSKLTDTSSDAFFLVAQLASPFLVYSLVINFLFGIMNKLSPQIPVYFISFPFVLAGGLLLLYFTFTEILRLFLGGFQMFLANG
jgi:flagellar biosynthesis protein FliR